jgi:mono/diheme cytochrome c family protein
VTSLKRFAFVTAICAFFASAALDAQFNAGFYTLQGPGSIRQTMPPAATASASYHVAAYTLYPAILAAGDGEQEVASYCNTCHSPRYITMQPPLPADAWTAEVNKMVKTYGASIPDDATQKIIHYLQSHYTPENRKK